MFFGQLKDIAMRISRPDGHVTSVKIGLHSGPLVAGQENRDTSFPNGTTLQNSKWLGLTNI
jgi:hypothetical protein